MKKPLNEELDRIKSIMGCCKGKINEDQENCVDPESPEGQQEIEKAVGYIKYEIRKATWRIYQVNENKSDF